ncbi:uncharacterized protein At4g04775-like [Eutrema salsugineum]|uniref:uncharacterized protein At4g04775-like n=1 Tax=Eutrema salsugineum TaxID=72664 RepID=UPI000CECFDE9|nr:uncharacterized protein At4g04775-like [Eutrema salsugineum]
MSNESGTSSGASIGHVGGRVVGVPKRCWCNEKIVARISKSEANPYRRYYRCAFAATQKLSNDNHVFKWVDEALQNEIETLSFRAARIEEELKEISRSGMEIEKMVYEKMVMKLEKEIFQKVEEVMVESEWKMKKMVALACVGSMVIVGCSLFLG